MLGFADRCAGVDIFGIGIDPHETSEWATLIGNQKVQGGLPAKTVACWKEVAAKFPTLTGAGAWGDRSHQARKSCHNIGAAVDFMTTNKALGDKVLAYLLANVKRLGLTVIIWWGRIYSAARKWVGRPYLGRSRHKDHLHVSIGCNG